MIYVCIGFEITVINQTEIVLLSSHIINAQISFSIIQCLTSETQYIPPSAMSANPAAFPKLHSLKRPQSPSLRRTIPSRPHNSVNHMRKRLLW